MARVAEVHIRVRDLRWFREVAYRTERLLERLDGEDLSPETEVEVAVLRRALRVPNPEDDLPGT